jgi:GTP cyclohydrolase I
LKNKKNLRDYADLGLDMTDDSLKDSPKRVAKMYVNEIFGGFTRKQTGNFYF